MQGLTLSNKRRTPHRDTFRAYLDIRPHCEPNCVWPFSKNLHQLKRQDANRESFSDYYLTSFSSVYADDILIKANPIKRIQNRDKFEANSASKVFGKEVRGYLTDNLSSGDEFAATFSRTNTFANTASNRTKAKERLEGVKRSKEPRLLSADIVDLILYKAQAIDPNQLESIDSVDKLSQQNSEIELCEEKLNMKPQPMSDSINNYWYRQHAHK